MMTEEILYARLKEALRDAIARHHLDERSISLKSRGLTPEEAIGRTARTDYPILNGREVMLQARFGEALGQAFTSAPVDFEGSLADVLELDTTHDPQAAGMLVATLNAVLRAVGEIGNTVHCRDDGPELCAERYAALVRERFGTPRIALVGFQPALLARLSKEFSVRVLDLNPEIVGTVRSGVLVEDGMAAYQDVVRDWAELERYRIWRQEEEERRYAAILGASLSLEEVADFRASLGMLATGEQERFQAVRQAEEQVRQQEQAVTGAQRAVALARREAAKIEKHRDIWQENAKREQEHLEDLELEEFATPSRASDDA